MPDNTVAVYYELSIVDFFQDEAFYWSLLDADEQAIALRFATVLLRQRYVVNHGLLRLILAQYVEDSAVDLVFKKTEWGKPFLYDYPQISFNLSHSGDCFALAVSKDCQLGIDIECYKPRQGYEGLVKRCFATEEANAWYDLPDEERGLSFYRYWVKKEAFVKAVGKGITVGLNQCVIDSDYPQRFLKIPIEYGVAEHWTIDFLEKDDVLMAVVCDKQALAVTYQLVSTCNDYLQA